MSLDAPLSHPPLPQDVLDENLGRVLNMSPIHVPRMIRLLEEGANPNYRDARGRPLLNILAGLGLTGALQKAIEAGADLTATDRYGGNALANAYRTETALLLLKAGVSPAAKNHEGLNAGEALLSGGIPESDDTKKSANLLRFCADIDKAAQAGQLSIANWEILWPSRPVAYPLVHARQPEYDTLAYFLQKMEENGEQLPKSYLSRGRVGTKALIRAIGESESAAVAWRDHCEKNGTPMSAFEWGHYALKSLSLSGGVACLFTADYWAGKPSLDEMYALFDHLPPQHKSHLNPRLQETLSDSLTTWMMEGTGKSLTRQELLNFRKEIPEALQPLLRHFHATLAERSHTPPTQGR